MKRSGLGPNGKRLLREGDQFDPPAGARARMDKALAARLGAAAVGGTVAVTKATAAAASGTAWAALSVKAAMVVAVGTVVVGAGVGAARWSETHEARRATTPAPTATVREPSPPVVEARTAPAASQQPVATSPPAPAKAPVLPKHVAVTAPASMPSAAPTPPAVSIGAEVSLLRDAQVARSSGDATTALALLDRYATEHPSGALHDLATTERALTLCALERSNEARAVARPLLLASPSSPLAARLAASCAGEKD